jgi:hypothetical protein
MYQSIIADYDTELAICELIDNAVDLWIKEGKTSQLKIDLDIDTDQQTIKVSDNAGGISEGDIKKIIAPGYTSNSSADETIGVFGVGSKRAVVAIAQEIKILTRYKKENTILLEYDDAWLKLETWDLPYHIYGQNISPNSTIIELTKLRNKIENDFIDELSERLGATYAKYLSNVNLSIIINDDIKIKPKFFDNSWSFPPKYFPQKVMFDVPIKGDNPIKVEILGGLVSEEQVGEGEYGVYFYCNDRLILRADKSYDFGFSSGLAGLPHPSLNVMRVFVYLNGNPEKMPWNSSKSGINFKKAIFKLIRERILQLVVYYSKLARKFQSDVHGNIYQYQSGVIEEKYVTDFTKPVKLNILPPPEKRDSYEKIVLEKNKDVAEKKPWVIGLYEGIIMTENIFETNFDQKNRFALIILDSTLEIAMKEYFVKVVAVKRRLGASAIAGIIRNRTELERHIKNFTRKISVGDWALIDHYYKMRCNLIHHVATADVKDRDIKKHRKVVEKALNKFFGLEF